PKAHD
ncbi:gamma-glutamyltranspeptidase family protein, partial [Vibrio parahaemolyticus V-223/04]